MQLLGTLATLLAFLLMHTTVLAGGSYYQNCACYEADKYVPDPDATKSACDAIGHSNYWGPTETIGGNANCEATGYSYIIAYGINDHCFDCLCRRKPGLVGRCIAESAELVHKIKCGGGC